jgi:hypothetical protein
MRTINLGVFLGQAYRTLLTTPLRSSAPEPSRVLSPLERLPMELKEMIFRAQDRPRDKTMLRSTSRTMRDSIGADGLVYPLTRQASAVLSLVDVVAVLGKPSDEDGRGGSGILGLPEPLQAVPLQELNRRLYRLPIEDRPEAAWLMAQATVAAGSDPEAMRLLTGAYPGESAYALDTTTVLWNPVHAFPLSDRSALLWDMAPRIRVFPYEERAERFSEHLSAWEELVEKNPAAVRATEIKMSPLVLLLPHRVNYLPAEARAAARFRIVAMKTALAQTPDLPAVA